MSGHHDHAISVTNFDASGNSTRSSPAVLRTIPPVMDYPALQELAPAPASTSLLTEPSFAQSQASLTRTTEANPQQHVSAPTFEMKDIEVTELTWTNDPHAALRAVKPATNIYGHTVSRYDSLRTVIIDGELVRFTPTEYRLLIPILEDHGKPVPFRHLTMSVLAREPDRDARRLLDKHVDHIRSKLRPFGLNVHCVARFGYLLLADE